MYIDLVLNRLGKTALIVPETLRFALFLYRIETIKQSDEYVD